MQKIENNQFSEKSQRWEEEDERRRDAFRKGEDRASPKRWDTCQAQNGGGNLRKILHQVGFEDRCPLPDPWTREWPEPASATHRCRKIRRNPHSSRFEHTLCLSVDQSALATWRHISARLHPPQRVRTRACLCVWGAWTSTWDLFLSRFDFRSTIFHPGFDTDLSLTWFRTYQQTFKSFGLWISRKVSFEGHASFLSNHTDLGSNTCRVPLVLHAC